MLRILWFNWRDIKNPEAGGAEVLTHEVTKRLSDKGHDITVFTSQFSNSLKTEEIDKVKIIRNGGKYSVYNKAKDHYNDYKHNYDIVIDEINTRPFLTPKFVKEKPIFALFHQLAADFWFYETRFPINYIGYYYLEKKWLSYYKDITTLTVSNSSRNDLVALGFKKVFIIPEGVSISPLSELKQKESNPVIVYLGRLKKAKLPHHAIQAFAMIKLEIPNAKMWVIGDGYMRRKLESGLDLDDVTFFGAIRDDLKYDLLSKAHLVLVPSIREGWGLVVTESNAMGTPAVAYNVPGLRDSVKDGDTGLLVKENSPRGLADSAVYLLKNKTLMNKFSLQALEFSRQFSWDKTAEIFDKIIGNKLNV